MATDINAKKAFEYRMSKKVAELTQVVHMLFTRNHEKEVEIEALKDAYEYEIELVIADAKGKIGDLDEECRTLKSKLISEREKLQRRLDKQLEERNEECKVKLAKVEKSLQDEKIECRNLRDLLISAQSDIEKLRHGINEQLIKKCDELDNRDKEQDRLLSQVAALEKVLQQNKKQADDTIKQLSKGNNRLQKDLDQIQNLLEETFKSKESLAMKNKQLEADFKTLQKDFKRKVSEVVASRNTSNHDRIQQETTITYDTADEIERLRREVQKYRLEISNRDANFNRMFTEKQRVHVDPRAGKIGQQQNNAVRSFSPGQLSSTSSKGRKLSYTNTEGVTSPQPTRFPTLSADHSLPKPKALTKEALLGK